ncbi:protein translocase component YidC [Azorhizobium oxalatiphilum]|uniref:Protein translocase component YidC n=1 Tax=Azorhizobium oxalatiphilum TaxID=980631 RepID=A0A917C3D7_9HYPH|nr:ABC transporter substrate-binding protein [Azorhizobium oxalatiphilum]GGF68759.1 protein translocase component YidC [Azorhizobium oxalatiphilum]
MTRRAPLLFALLCLLPLTAPASAQETRLFKDDLGRSVTVPAKPLRIVSLHDLDITIPLIELGARPVASHGRTRLDGTHFLRSSAILTGVDFDNSDIKFIGTTSIDIEAVVAAKPDLIITEPSRNTPIEQLEKIAPTVSLDNRDGGAGELYGKIADLTGTQAQLAILERRYRMQIAQLRSVVDTGAITVVALQANKGKITVHHTQQSLGQVLRDAGFRFPALVDAIPPGKRMDVSAERLPELDADFIFDTYRSDQGGKPADEIADMEKVMPGYCAFLKACREGRYTILAREEAISNSYAALSLMVSTIQSQVSGRQPPLKRP